MLYRGVHHSIYGLSKETGISDRTLRRWLAAGLLSEAYIDAYFQERALFEAARSVGLRLVAARNRVRRGWDTEAAYTTPPKRVNKAKGTGQ